MKKNKIEVKICGITNLEDALFAVKSGADALGFIFYKKSKRYISPNKVKSIVKNLPKKILKVGVFVDAKAVTLNKISKECNLDILQLHGEESVQFCAGFKNVKVLKGFRVGKDINLAEVLKYKTFGVLFDTYSASIHGGTGKQFDYSQLAKIRKQIKNKLFLSGGLKAENVREAVKKVQPNWVDVSSSVEIGPGVKDWNKVSEFISKAKNV